MNENVKELLLKLIDLGFLNNTKRANGEYVEADGVMGPKTKLAYINYLNSANKPSPATYSERDFNDIKLFESDLNTRDNVDIINSYHSAKRTNQPYIIDDKKNNKLNVYLNGLLLRSFDAIHGKYSTEFGHTFNKLTRVNKDYTVKAGDSLSVIARDNNINMEDLIRENNIQNPNLIKPGQTIKIRSKSRLQTEIDPDEMTITYVDANGHIKNMEGNLVTPAGFYYTDASGTYHGAPSFIRRTKDQLKSKEFAGIPSSIHARTIKEGANTNGCTGLSSKDLLELKTLLDGYLNIETYILPANDKNKFQIRNGNLEFSSHDLSLTPSHHVIDYSPIAKIKFSNEGLDEHQKDVYTNFSRGLIKYKTNIQKDLGINNDTYIQLAQAALGIFGAESNYGKEHNAISNFARAVNKWISHDNSSPDIYSKYSTYGANEDTNSIGLTLIRLKRMEKGQLVDNISPKAQELFKKYNITKDDLVYNPEKAALATMIVLSTSYLNRGMSLRNAIADWNPRPNYYDRVMKNSNRAVFTLKYLDFNAS